MNENEDHKIEVKERIVNFFNTYKVKIYILLIILSTFLILFTYFKINNEKKNIIVAEKYVEAGLYLSVNKKKVATSLYEEIILSNNKIYSILALNTVIEKNLISNEKKILEYFKILNSSNLLKEQKELLSLKKALYLIKNSDTKNGMKLLNQLKDENLNLKPIIQEILEN